MTPTPRLSGTPFVRSRSVTIPTPTRSPARRNASRRSRKPTPCWPIRRSAPLMIREPWDPAAVSHRRICSLASTSTRFSAEWDSALVRGVRPDFSAPPGRADAGTKHRNQYRDPVGEGRPRRGRDDPCQAPRSLFWLPWLGCACGNCAAKLRGLPRLRPAHQYSARGRHDSATNHRLRGVSGSRQCDRQAVQRMRRKRKRRAR